MAHVWIPIISILMIGIGIIVVLSGFDAAPIVAYQIIILGSMLIGLGFLSVSIYVLLSHVVAMSEVETGYLAKQATKPSPTTQTYEKTYQFCENCGKTLKSGAKFCGECGTTQP